MRAELTTVERDEHLVRRKELWGRRDSGPTCPTIKGPGQPKGFAADTAKATGMSKRKSTSVLDENAAQRLMKAARLDAAKATPASDLETAQRLIKSAGANRKPASVLDTPTALKLSRLM